MEEPTNQETPNTPPEKSSVGPAIGTIIIIIILVLGGLYFWNTRLSRTDTGDEQTQELKDVSNSDEVEDLESDLANTNLNNLDDELRSIEEDLEAGSGTTAQ